MRWRVTFGEYDTGRFGKYWFHMVNQFNRVIQSRPHSMRNIVSIRGYIKSNRRFEEVSRCQYECSILNCYWEQYNPIVTMIGSRNIGIAFLFDHMVIMFEKYDKLKYGNKTYNNDWLRNVIHHRIVFG